jgi:hypothetical protein
MPAFFLLKNPGLSAEKSREREKEKERGRERAATKKVERGEM